MILSIIVISIIGTISHFLYDLSNHNKILGLFVAVNESTWEHIKIAITPTLLYSLYDGIIYGFNPNYFTAKLISLLSLCIFIPLIFYTYQIFTKKSIAFINILIFYISIIISQFLFYCIINAEPVSKIIQYISVVGLFILFGAYLLLTLLPLKNPLFKDPITNKYGFNRHNKNSS